MSRAMNPLTGKLRQGGKMWKKVRGIVLDRDSAYHNGIRTCEYCGGAEGEEVMVYLKSYGEEVKRTLEMTVDHIIPFSQGGGEFDLDNLITCCSVCNNVHNDREKPGHILMAVQGLAKIRNRAISEGKEGEGE